MIVQNGNLKLKFGIFEFKLNIFFIYSMGVNEQNKAARELNFDNSPKFLFSPIQSIPKWYYEDIDRVDFLEIFWYSENNSTSLDRMLLKPLFFLTIV